MPRLSSSHAHFLSLPRPQCCSLGMDSCPTEGLAGLPGSSSLRSTLLQGAALLSDQNVQVTFSQALLHPPLHFILLAQGTS